MLRIWRQYRHHYGLQTSISAPIAANFAYSPSMMDTTFLQWLALGIATFSDLYIDNVFASFQQLAEKFALPRHNFFRHLQVRRFVQDKYPQFPSLPTVNPIDSFFKPIHNMKGMISYLYDLICTQCKILHRTHWTKVRLSKKNPEVDSTCDRCHQAPATTYVLVLPIFT